jgi:predicted homoserine dehydrogenase-like protein
MGRGIAMQVHATPGLRLSWVADIHLPAATSLANQFGCVAGESALHLLESNPVDVLVEATNRVGAGADHSFAALQSGAHVVLMNAETDLALGPLLQGEASSRDLVVTSDAGDQHGVLAAMIDEADLMGLEVVQAGNIKGFLDRYATPESIRAEAAVRRLSPEQCCAYTDGTKLHVEMALVANGFGYLPPDGGMTGPRAHNVTQALDLFDFDSYGETPRVDYILGAEPGGGVYLVVQPKRSLPDEQAFYLSYYKLGNGPRYLLYRPYHLCHLETPKAIFSAVAGRAILAPATPKCDVYAYAKRDLQPGQMIEDAIGSAECYGLVGPCADELVPLTLLESRTTVTRAVAREQPITFDDIELSDSRLTALWRRQREMLTDTA